MLILIDMDSTITELCEPWLAAAARCCPGPPVSRADWTSYKQPPAVGCGDHFFDHLTGDLYRSLLPIPGAIAAIGMLERLGHEVLILSASAKHPDTAAAKFEWIERWLGWTRHKVIIGQRKELVRGDVFIDDHPDNLTAWVAANPAGLPLTIGYPYNACLPRDWRCGSIDQPESAWAEIVGRIAAWGRQP